MCWLHNTKIPHEFGMLGNLQVARTSALHSEISAGVYYNVELTAISYACNSQMSSLLNHHSTKYSLTQSVRFILGFPFYCTQTRSSLIKSNLSVQTMGVQPFLWQKPHPSLWAGSQAARGKMMSGIPNRLNHCVIFIVYKLQIWPRAT
jgi:hypothetical protein